MGDPVKMTEAIKSISLCGKNLLQIDTDDNVYAIGPNSHGQLGLGDTKDRSSLTKVTMLTGRALKVQCSVSCSENFWKK